MAIAICLTLCLKCAGTGRNEAEYIRMGGIDIGSAMREGSLDLGISRLIAPHWSLEASHLIRLQMTRRSRPEEVQEHYETLSYAENAVTSHSKELLTSDITVSYWIKEGYKGAFVQAGCRSGIRQRPAGIIGAGYCIRIWKGFACTLTYDATLQRQSEDKLGLTISYMMR